MTVCFLTGPMAEPSLYGAVIGQVPAEPARLDGYRLAAFASGAVALATPDDAEVTGVMLALDEGALARLDHVMRSMGGQARTVSVSALGTNHTAQIWCGADATAPDWQPEPGDGGGAPCLAVSTDRAAGTTHC